MNFKVHKWKEKMDVTYEEFFNPPFYVPHPAIVEITRELERILGEEKTHEIIGTLSDKLHVNGITKRYFEDKSINSLQDFDLSEFMEDSPVFPCAVTAEVIEDTPKRQVNRATECLFAETYKRMGAEDVGYLWNCRTDFAQAKAASPNIRMTMPKCIMKGDEYCEFIYTWEEE